MSSPEMGGSSSISSLLPFSKTRFITAFLYFAQLILLKSASQNKDLRMRGATNSRKVKDETTAAKKLWEKQCFAMY